jgi:hypothetical protein
MSRSPTTRLALLTLLLGAACATGDEASRTSFGGLVTASDTGSAEAGDDSSAGGDESGGQGDGICLLHNCDEDLECAGCTEGRTTCLVEEHRCIACDPATGEGCAEGEECTEFGYCVPAGLTCPTDGAGDPTAACDVDDDCAACDPFHQVCDTATHQCVACTDGNLEGCQATEHCVMGECVADCPAVCDSDADCSMCGAAGHEAHACVAHQCAQCSDSVPCSGGQVCNDHGVCNDVCGLPGEQMGTCDVDADCAACPGDAIHCVVPINGGHGSCGPEAAGCSDLGSGVVVLPAPYDQVTNLCSDDMDCAGIGIQLNVGELLRDMTGIDDIGDAIVEYPMGVCAEVTVGIDEAHSVSCGVCVPCEVDSDCQDIDIDQVAEDLFGDLGGIAAALLLDTLFGPSDHEIHMFCQEVGAGYGVCAPCPSLLNDCTQGGGGGGAGGGSCDHDTCTTGGPLDPSCSDCAAEVCAVDDYCCSTAWDDICVGEVAQYCAGGCDGGSGGACGHDECTAGAALDPGCSACTDAVCAADSYCCQTAWDDVCVGEVAQFCGESCDGGGGGCIHDECTAGGPLTQACSSCAADVCAVDDYCCTTEWDQQCIDEADQVCVFICGGGGGFGCAHDECAAGIALDPFCSDCAQTVCGFDAYCCETAWDDTCVNEAADYCGC